MTPLRTLLLLLIFLVPVRGWAEVTPYPTDLGETSTAYAVTADGVEIPTVAANFTPHKPERKWWFEHFARFAFDPEAGPVEVVITLPGEGARADTDAESVPITGWTIQPTTLKLDATATERELRITLNEPRNLRIVMNDREALNLFVYPPYHAPSGFEYMRSWVLKPEEIEGDVTTFLQKAIDGAADGDTSGHVVLADGTFTGGDDSTLYLRSNTHLYLSPGTIVRKIRVVAEDADNVSVTGHGILDFTDSPGVSQAGKLLADDCNHVEFRDLFLWQTTDGWSVRLHATADMVVDNLKVFGTRDGIDPTNAHRITIRNCYILSLDDCIAIKGWKGRGGENNLASTEDILVENNLLHTTGYRGIKIGTETSVSLFRNIICRDNYVISAGHAIGITLYDGAEIDNFVIDGFVAENARRIGFELRDRRGKGNPHAITLRNINFWTHNDSRSTVEVIDEKHRFTDTLWHDVVLAGQPVRSADHPLVNVLDPSEVAFEFDADYGKPIPHLMQKLLVKKGNAAMAAMFDGDFTTSFDHHVNDRLTLDFDLGEPTTLTRIRVRGLTDKWNGVGGFSVAVTDGEDWKTLIERRHAFVDHWIEVPFADLTTQRLRITLHAPPSRRLRIPEITLYRTTPGEGGD